MDYTFSSNINKPILASDIQSLSDVTASNDFTFNGAYNDVIIGPNNNLGTRRTLTTSYKNTLIVGENNIGYASNGVIIGYNNEFIGYNSILIGNKFACDYQYEKYNNNIIIGLNKSPKTANLYWVNKNDSIVLFNKYNTIELNNDGDFVSYAARKIVLSVNQFNNAPDYSNPMGGIVLNQDNKTSGSISIISDNKSIIEDNDNTLNMTTTYIESSIIDFVEQGKKVYPKTKMSSLLKYQNESYYISSGGNSSYTMTVYLGFAPGSYGLLSYLPGATYDYHYRNYNIFVDNSSSRTIQFAYKFSFVATVGLLSTNSASTGLWGINAPEEFVNSKINISSSLATGGQSHAPVAGSSTNGGDTDIYYARHSVLQFTINAPSNLSAANQNSWANNAFTQIRNATDVKVEIEY